ncbi:MAG: hypothetical protein AAGF75_13500 [Cyanobacteria bacterium P01_H01_bin.130]
MHGIVRHRLPITLRVNNVGGWLFGGWLQLDHTYPFAGSGFSIDVLVSSWFMAGLWGAIAPTQHPEGAITPQPLNKRSPHHHPKRSPHHHPKRSPQSPTKAIA